MPDGIPVGGALQRPASTVFAVQESVGGGVACDAQVGPVPHQLLLRAHGDVAHETDFGQQPGVIDKVRARGGPPRQAATHS